MYAHVWLKFSSRYLETCTFAANYKTSCVFSYRTAKCMKTKFGRIDSAGVTRCNRSTTETNQHIY